MLELGFGGGVSLERLLAIDGGAVVAVDPSIEMVERARRRFSTGVHGRRLSLIQATAELLPLGAGSLDAVVSVHSLYYWHDWKAGLREVARALAPNGALILGSGMRANEHAQALGLDRAGFRAPSPDDIRITMSGAGPGWAMSRSRSTVPSRFSLAVDRSTRQRQMARAPLAIRSSPAVGKSEGVSLGARVGFLWGPAAIGAMRVPLSTLWP